MKKAMKDADTHQYKVESGAFAKGQLMAVVKSAECAQRKLIAEAGTLIEEEKQKLNSALAEGETAKRVLRNWGVKI